MKTPPVGPSLGCPAFSSRWVQSVPKRLPGLTQSPQIHFGSRGRQSRESVLVSAALALRDDGSDKSTAERILGRYRLLNWISSTWANRYLQINGRNHSFPLHEACRLNAAFARKLIQSGADITTKRPDEEGDLNGATPLIITGWTPNSESADACRLLLGHAEKTMTPKQVKDYVNTQNALGKTALLVALEQGFYPYSDRDTKQEHEAAAWAIIALLLDHWADITVVDNGGMSPYHYAREHPQSPGAELVLQAAKRQWDPEPIPG
jgi:ankyrin repeat protein